MNTPEERLAAILRAEAETLIPVGDGLSKIQARLVRRKRARFLLLPGAALAVSGAAAAFFLLGPGTGPTTLTQQPGDQPNPTATGVVCDATVVEGTCPTAEPTSSPAPTVAPVVRSDVFPAIWPFPDAAASLAYDEGAMPWASDADEVAKRFLEAYFAGAGLSVEGTGPSSYDVVHSSTGKVGTLTLRQHVAGAGRPWTVTAAGGTDLTVTQPTAGGAISSPALVSGRVMGVDENVRLRLVTAAGTQLDDTGAPAGSEAPWHTALTWSETDWSHAAVVATTGSPKDGALSRIVVVPVIRGDTTGPTFAALVDGRVDQFDAVTGKKVKQLTFPPAGASDTGIAWASGTLAWVRTKATGCQDSLNRLDGGVASTVVPAGQARLAGPRLSPSGALLAWTQTPCGSDRQSIVVRGGGAPDRVLQAPTGMSARVLDVTEDGALLVHLNDLDASNAGTVGRLAPGAQSLDGLKALAPTGSCYLAGAATFADDGEPVAWETCEGRSRLARFADDGARLGAGPLVDATVIVTTAFRDGAYVLEVRSRSGGPTVARYLDGKLSYLTTCDVGSTTCVGSPDW